MSTSTELVPADIDARAEEVERQVVQATAQAEAMQVRDAAEADQAAVLLKQIATRRKAAEAERVELTKPLLDTKKRIDQKFKDAMAPFDAADKIVREKVGVWSAEQDRIRREEEARLEAERVERERKAREVRERQEAQEREKREQAQREAREAEELAAKAKDAEDAAAAEQLAEEARTAAAEAATAEQAIAALPDVQLPKATVEAPAKPAGISTRKRWRVKSMDVGAMPAHLLEPNKTAVGQALRGALKDTGQPPEIPGVVFEQVDEMAVRS